MTNQNIIKESILDGSLGKTTSLTPLLFQTLPNAKPSLTSGLQWAAWITCRYRLSFPFFSSAHFAELSGGKDTLYPFNTSDVNVLSSNPATDIQSARLGKRHRWLSDASRRSPTLNLPSARKCEPWKRADESCHDFIFFQFSTYQDLKQLI